MSEEKEYCCEYMEYALSGRNGYLINYNPTIRSYSLLFYRGNKFTGMQKQLWYCPWCGTELPESLSFKIGDVLEEEYGITEKDWDDESKIPEEFKSDEWWKKRGL